MTSDPAALAAHISLVPPRPSWLALRARPEYVRKAREFARTAVFGFPFDAYDVGLVTSEVVTNAILATTALRPWPDDVYPIGLELIVTDRYLHLAVTDPDHRPLPASDKGGLLAKGGRGLFIVDQGADARWVTYADQHKTVHILLAAPGVVLTEAELQRIGAST